MAATTNRTIGRLAARMSMTAGPSSTIAATATTVITISNGTTVKMTLPGKVSRSRTSRRIRHRTAIAALRRARTQLAALTLSTRP